MTEDEIEELDNIEEALIESGMPLEDIGRHYSLFLLDLIGSITPVNESNEDIAKVTHLLRNICRPHFLEKHDLKEERIMLWDIEKRYREELPEFSLMARCAIYCCANKARWSSSNSSEETPMFFMVHTAEKINSKYVKVLIEHFKKLIPS